MTKDEAINIVRQYECCKEHYEACELLIKLSEPCEDAVSRADVRQLITKVDRENGGISSKSFKALYYGADALPSVNVQRKSNADEKHVGFALDAISRKSILKYIDDWWSDNRDNIEDLIIYITYLPSVTVRQTQAVEKSNFDVNQYKVDIDTAYECGKASERQTGEWIDRGVYDADRWKCSKCGRTEQWKENFCPNCGADMRGGE